MSHVHAKSNTAYSSSQFLRAFRQFSWPRATSHAASLDIRTLPDHLKRDMGILDGNDPSGRRK
ncbi:MULTISPECIES: hypothetical protein [unclassified Mesorhizobium]|uniref:hypothetical protein n=1 Tax=unclassified Mesorhizobium TaxID=325217 RepID=UPI003015116B